MLRGYAHIKMLFFCPFNLTGHGVTLITVLLTAE